jgi:CDP-diacylglycerol---glycerol-3-phosphate 3-phosphatidyltransferase
VSDALAKRPSTFGPSAVATPANAMTLARLLATPVLILLIGASGPGWGPFIVVFAVAVTDGADGWIARRQGVTRSGAFLDPLADKAVVLGALFALAARGELAWLPVGLIAAREASMSIYRSVAGRRGVSIPARLPAKMKTVVQDVVVGLCLLPGVSDHRGALSVALWLAVALTLGTGVQYLIDGRRVSREARSGASTGIPRGTTASFDLDPSQAEGATG